MADVVENEPDPVEEPEKLTPGGDEEDEIETEEEDSEE